MTVLFANFGLPILHINVHKIRKKNHKPLGNQTTNLSISQLMQWTGDWTNRACRNTKQATTDYNNVGIGWAGADNPFLKFAFLDFHFLSIADRPLEPH